MPVKGVGLDIIRIERIKGVYSRRPERFLQRIFTDKERSALLEKKNMIPSLATRFATKEAVSKALGCGIGAISWREIEISAAPGGKPVVSLTGKAAAWAEEHGIEVVHISMSHDGLYAAATAVAEGSR